MKIALNESPYDTRAVRRILVAVRRMFGTWRFTQRWANLTVRLHAGRAATLRTEIYREEAQRDCLAIYLPPLRGDEFVGLLRQQQGGTASVGLSTYAVALTAQMALGRMFELIVPKTGLVDVRPFGKLPKLVPLRIIKPAEKRDRVRESYERVLELEQKWQRKAKLAATKLKTLRRRRKYYEKRFKEEA